MSKICKMILSLFFLCICHTDSLAQKVSETFESKISEAAQQYIGLPYMFGGDPEKAGSADNSHLLCAIYERAATLAGLRFAGYMPMRMLMRHTIPVRQESLKDGDLMVLRDGHAAMIYNLRSPEHFDLVYASLKKQEVISFNSRNAVFEAYWLSNLEGYYRPAEKLFAPR
ncbi:MAG: peptidoglycan endopeptidase [Desulfobacterales bacterium]